MFIYITNVYMFLCTYIYIWSRLPTARSPPSICKLLAAFLRSSLVFARFLQRFWLPASHLLGTCYLLGDLRSTHTPSKYLRATYSHIYMCYVSTSYIYIHVIYIYIHTYSYFNIHTHNIYIYKYAHIYIYSHIYIHKDVHTHIYRHINIYIYRHIYIYKDIYIYRHKYIYIYIYTYMFTYIYI